jgi:hypothetical protein
MKHLETTLLDAGMSEKNLKRWLKDRETDRIFNNYLLFNKSPKLVEDTPVEDTPVEDTPVEDTPVEDTSVEDTPVEEVVKTPKKEKKTKVPNAPKKPPKWTAFNHLKENPDIKIEFVGEKGGKNAELFNKYKVATTFQEYMNILESIDKKGEARGHLNYDFKTHLLKIDDPSVIHPEPKKKKTPAKKAPKAYPLSEVEKFPKKEKAPKKKISPKKEKAPKKVRKIKKDDSEPVEEPSVEDTPVEEPSVEKPSVEEPEIKSTSNVKEKVQNIEKKIKEEQQDVNTEDVTTEEEDNHEDFYIGSDDDESLEDTTINGEKLILNKNDNSLICKSSGIVIGYLKDDDTIEYLNVN